MKAIRFLILVLLALSTRASAGQLVSVDKVMSPVVIGSGSIVIQSPTGTITPQDVAVKSLPTPTLGIPTSDGLSHIALNAQVSALTTPRPVAVLSLPSPAAGQDVNPKSTPAAPWPISGVVTVIVPTSTATPAGGIGVNLVSTPGAALPISGAVTVIVPTSTAIPAAGISMNPLSTPAASWPVTLPTAITVANNVLAVTAVPTAVANGTIIPETVDVFGARRVVLSYSNGVVIPVNASGDNQNYQSLAVNSQNTVKDGQFYSMQRSFVQYNCLTITASGSTAIIGPNTNGGNSPLTSGNKWRLMGYSITFSGDALDASNNCYVKFIDNATTMGPAFYAQVPSAATTPVYSSQTTGWIPLGNGIISASANNALNVNLSSALTAGVVTVCVGFLQTTAP